MILTLPLIFVISEHRFDYFVRKDGDNNGVFYIRNLSNNAPLKSTPKGSNEGGEIIANGVKIEKNEYIINELMSAFNCLQSFEVH
jgi:hypothetical protein